MPSATGLDTDMSAAIERVGSADVLVGIPSYRNAATIGHVAGTVAEGLRLYFPDARAVVVSSDGGSDDGTSERVREALDGTPSVVGAYRGLPGKGSALRAVFEAAGRLGARACAVVDSDLRSITPEWVERLLRPVIGGTAEYVAPLYARHKHDGTITNTVAYPLTRALYGKRVRQPIGGEFAFTGDLARAFLEGGAFVPRERGPRRGAPGARTEARSDEVEHPGASEGSARASVGADLWSGDVARFGIDVYMTTTALVRGARVAQAYLGAKIHDPKDPGADLAPMFRQVVGTGFRLAARNAEAWRGVSSSAEVPVVGEARPAEPEEVRADAGLLVRKLRAGAAEKGAIWDEALSPDAAAAVRRALAEDVPRALAGEAWATILYDLLAASARRPERTDAYVLALVPLYFGRVAAFIAEARDMSTAESERLVEEQATALESRKAYLERIWPSG